MVANGEASALCVQIDLQMDCFIRGVVPQLEAERGFLRVCACRGVIIAVYGLVASAMLACIVNDALPLA